MMTLRQHFDLVVEKFAYLDAELRHVATQEAAGHERPELQRACMLAMLAIIARWAELKQRLADGEPDADVAEALIVLDRDITATVFVLQGKLRLIAEGEEPN